jgi:hypothetical protein
MSPWSHLIFEAFCMYDHMSQKRWKTYRMEFDEKHNLIKTPGEKPNIHINKDYIPKKRRPSWCRKKNKKRCPRPECQYTMCPFLALVEVNKKEYIAMMKAWERMPAKDKEDD